MVNLRVYALDTMPINIAYLWVRDNYKTVLTGLQSRLFNLKELNDNLCYEGENPSGKVVPLKLVEEHLSVN